MTGLRVGVVVRQALEGWACSLMSRTILSLTKLLSSGRQVIRHVPHAKAPPTKGSHYGYCCSWQLQLEGLGNVCRDNCCLLSLRLGSWSVSPCYCLCWFVCICLLHVLQLTGVGPKVPKQSAIMGAMIGGLGGFMLAYQQSSGDSHRNIGT